MRSARRRQNRYPDRRTGAARCAKWSIMAIRLAEQGERRGAKRAAIAALLLAAALIVFLGLWWKDELVGEATLLGLPVAGSSHSGNNPFADVPSEHWSYAAITELQQSGLFSGYPNGTFDGRRLITRYEFAVALERLKADAQRAAALNGRSRRAACRRIAVLCREFAPELNMLGADPGAMCRDLNYLSLPGRRLQPPSQGVPVNIGGYPSSPSPIVDRDGRLVNGA
jgi:hypothetical protein